MAEHRVIEQKGMQQHDRRAIALVGMRIEDIWEVIVSHESVTIFA
jgi:hypothetical protein